MSTKHLSRIELHTTAPPDDYSALGSRIAAVGLRALGFKRHPRSRVWEEERHRYLPAWSVRRIYRLLIAPTAFLSARGSQGSSTARAEEHDGGA